MPRESYLEAVLGSVMSTVFRDVAVVGTEG